MTTIDHARCIDLVRTLADGLATTGLETDANGAISDIVAHVRTVSHAAETRMRVALAELYPAIGWTGEEGRPADTDYWLYDPIDGAYHWLQGLPLWSSSLVLVRGGEPVFAIVYDPAMREVFVAEAHGGARCNNHVIHASLKSDPAAAVVGTAIPPLGQVGAAEQDEALDLLRCLARSVFVVRPMAAASLQLAYVAAGRLDAYAENGQDAADWLAGALLVREAGGVVTDLGGERFGWSGNGILAANSALYPVLHTAIGINRAEALTV